MAPRACAVRANSSGYHRDQPPGISNRGAATAVKRKRQNRMQWALLALNAVVCAALASLQYRWTGELSRAEPAFLRAGLNEQVRRLAQTFNEDIRESCTLLQPDANQIRSRGLAAAHRVQYEQWA